MTYFDFVHYATKPNVQSRDKVMLTKGGVRGGWT